MAVLVAIGNRWHFPKRGIKMAVLRYAGNAKGAIVEARGDPAGKIRFQADLVKADTIA